MTEHHEHHVMRTATLATIWGALLILTATTVWVSTIDLGFLNVAVALTIASCKALLVVFWFMHLRYENTMLKTMVLITFVVLAIFIGFTFFDVAYR